MPHSVVAVLKVLVRHQAGGVITCLSNRVVMGSWGGLYLLTPFFLVALSGQ